MTSSVASTAAIEMGLPPNVESERPVNAFATSSVAIVAPTGNPLAIDFANVMISGSTPQCSMPHHLSPVRPQPVCTSSQIKTAPYLRMMPTAISKYSLGGVMKPPAP